MNKKENIKAQEYLNAINCADEENLLTKRSIHDIIDYIVKFNKEKLLKRVLQLSEKYPFSINSFAKIKTGSLFSVFLYSDYIKNLIRPGITTTTNGITFQSIYTQTLLKMGTRIKGGLEMCFRKFKKNMNPDQNKTEKPLVLDLIDICNVLSHGSFKDVKILIKNDYLSRENEDDYAAMLTHLLYNDTSILEYILQIHTLFIKIFKNFKDFDSVVIKMIWDYTVYSKFFNEKNIKIVLNNHLTGIPSFTKKLSMLNNHNFMNSETIHDTSISKRMVTNFNKKQNTKTFCKYNNFTKINALYTPPFSHSDIFKPLLTSMVYNQYYITVSLGSLESSVLYDLYPSIPSGCNKKLEYSICTVSGTQVYIITDYYSEGLLVDRINALSKFHPWARKEFKDLKEEMDALKEFLSTSLPKNSKVWWPRKYISTDISKACEYPDTLYENNGWLFIDDQGLGVNFNSKYAYVFHNTQWVYTTKIDPKLKVLQDGAGKADGLWKCEWLPEEELEPIELMGNNFASPSTIHLDINELINFYNGISIPCNFKARAKVNPSENSLIRPLSLNIGCGMDVIKNLSVQNLDINPFYTGHCIHDWSRSSPLVIKYSDWMIDSSNHFVEFLKNISSAEYLYMVMIDADLISDKWYFDDGDENHPQSYIEKLESTWSCDVYKARGFLSWIHPWRETPYDFYIASTKFFEDALATRLTPGQGIKSDWISFYVYRHSPIVGIMFKNEKHATLGLEEPEIWFE